MHVFEDEIESKVLEVIEEQIVEKHEELGCAFIKVSTRANADSILGDLDIDEKISNCFSADEDYKLCFT